MMLPDVDELLACADVVSEPPLVLGHSREGRELCAYRFGGGPVSLSLIAGCHADEPVGPRLLGHLTRFLSQLDDDEALLDDFSWWIVPHANPDGAWRNRHWTDIDSGAYDCATYLRSAVRELPGDDVEFGFPRSHDDTAARPENRVIASWWVGAGRPFDFHISLHGMAFAGGPWFLVEPAWRDRVAPLMQACSDETRRLGYRLHDVQRHGEKGFERLARGFATRPNSQAMKEFFMRDGDTATAALFRPSSMETIRAFGGDALTLVSEVPLFVVPGVGDVIDPDREADTWRQRIAAWKQRLTSGDAGAEREIASSGIRAVPLEDQWRLQWTFIRTGIERVVEQRSHT